MKYRTVLIIAIGLIGISSCSSDDDDIFMPNCEIISQNIQRLLLENGGPSRTRIEWAGMFNDGPGVPSFDGCIINQNDRFWNLEQIISYELRDDRLILRFP